MSQNIRVDAKIAQSLNLLHDRQATGELIISLEAQPSSTWHLYFYLGRLVYATGGRHRARRWVRALRQNCPHWQSDDWLSELPNTQDPWEYYLLHQALERGTIDAGQAKAIVQTSIQEVLFALIDRPIANTQWKQVKWSYQNLVFLSGDAVIQQIFELTKQWRSLGVEDLQVEIAGFSPDLAPVVRSPDRLKTQVSPEAFQTLSVLLNSQNTLWDVALRMQRPVTAIVRSLLALIREGIIGFNELPDLAFGNHRPVTAPVDRGPKATIACIDDSPLVGQELTRILKPAGYEVLTILDPLRGVSILLNRKPDLIFLDLVMPNTNGYELCSFLRKSATFQNTPIVILTGHDGVVDRVRAKMAGSSDFMGKPPDAEKVLQVVRKYLGDEADEANEANDGHFQYSTMTMGPI